MLTPAFGVSATASMLSPEVFPMREGAPPVRNVRGKELVGFYKIRGYKCYIILFYAMKLFTYDMLGYKVQHHSY